MGVWTVRSMWRVCPFLAPGDYGKKRVRRSGFAWLADCSCRFSVTPGTQAKALALAPALPLAWLSHHEGSPALSQRGEKHSLEGELKGVSWPIQVEQFGPPFSFWATKCLSQDHPVLPLNTFLSFLIRHPFMAFLHLRMGLLKKCI